MSERHAGGQLARQTDRRRSASRWTWLRRMWGLSTGRFSIIVIIAVVVTAIVSLFWTPFDPQKVDIAGRWATAGLAAPARHRRHRARHPDLVMAGARTTVLVAVGAGIVATVIGISLAASARSPRAGCASRWRSSSTSSSPSPC